MSLPTIASVDAGGVFSAAAISQIDSNFALCQTKAASGNVEVTGTLTVDGASTLTGNALLSGLLHAVGAVTFDSTLTW